MKSLTIKIGILYVLLTVFTISFFSIFISLNQVDLITKRIYSEASVKIEKIYSPLKGFLRTFRSSRQEQVTRDQMLESLTAFLNNLHSDHYAVYSEEGGLLYKRTAEIVLDKIDIKEFATAISNEEFSGKAYTIKIFEKSREIYFFIPIVVNEIDHLIVCSKFEMEDINEHYFVLYRMIFIVIGVVLVLQILFGFLLYSIVILPIKQINEKSLEIKQGALSSRVKIKRKDEIGQLSLSFNEMASSIEDKINQLKDKNEIMEFELDAAGKVQSGIYPQENMSCDLFDLSVYHRPLHSVSGDYHDVFKISDSKYGFLVADVSGHGVPAALVTMKIKDTFMRNVAQFNDTKELFVKVNTELSDLMNTFSCFFTAFYCLMDGQRIIYSTAGHPVMYLLRPDEQKMYNLKTSGYLMGISESVNTQFQSKTGKVRPGDKIILFSDGIIEAMNEDDRQYEADRLIRQIVRNRNKDCIQMNHSIVNDLTRHIGSAKRRDDETLLIIDIK